MDYLLAWVLGLALFFAVVFLLFWLITRMTGALVPRTRSARDAGLNVLRERLVRGEITQAEFDEARRILGDT